MVTSFLLFAFYLYFVSCFYYLRYTRKNTPSDRFCTSCLRGFSNRCFIINHRCDRKKGRNGRYCCRTCLYETERRVKITKHSDKCSTKKLNIHLIEKVMTSKNTPLVQLCPFCGKGFNRSANRDIHIKRCKENDDRKRVETKQWSCRECDKSFLLQSCAHEHVKSIHGGMSFKRKKRGEKVNFRYKKLVVLLDMDELDETRQRMK